MSAPTTSILLNQTTPAATSGDQNAVIQSDGATPQQSITITPKRATGPLFGTVKIDQLQQESFVYAADTGTANAYVVTLSPAPTIVAGSEVVFKAANANTGSSTLAVNGGTATAIQRNDGTALQAGDIPAGGMMTVKYDGSVWKLPSGAGGGAGGNTLLNGSGAPSSGLGNNGDFYLDTTNQILYGPKTGGAWGTGVYLVDRSVRLASAVPGKPAAAQNVLIYTAETTEIYPANFATPNSYGTVGANPAATATYSVYKNTTLVGQISIATSGAFTFSTTSGATISLNAGDRFAVVAPGAQDTTLSDVSFTLVGTRGTISTAALPTNPVFTFRGAYNGATAYNVGDVITYSGSSYICILASTGNLPTNATYWQLIAQAGTNGTNGTNGQIQIVDFQNETAVYCVDTGAANAYVVAPSTAVTSYVAGLRLKVLMANAPTGASTINVSGLGAKAITKNGTSALTGNEWAANQIVELVYDGTQAQLQGAGGGGSVPAAISTEVDWPPSSANAMDDEFASGSSVNLSLWTWLQQGTATAAVKNSCLNLAVPTNSGDTPRMLYQTLPTAPWTFLAKVAVSVSATSNYFETGLGLYDSANGKVQTFGPAWDGSAHMSSWVGSLTTGLAWANETVWTFLGNCTGWAYLQLACVGTTITFSVSYDGVAFTTIYSGSLTANLTSPSKVGLIFNNNGSRTGNLVCDFFRRTV